MLDLIEKALKELAVFRRSSEIDTGNAVALADCLDDLVRELASGDPEAADLYDRFCAEVYGDDVDSREAGLG
ncbi:MAG: hypothetical protein ACPLRW_06605 [Moorellales bacterium]